MADGLQIRLARIDVAPLNVRVGPLHGIDRPRGTPLVVTEAVAEASRCADALIRINPRDTEAVRDRYVSLVIMQHFERVGHAAKQLIAINPDHIDYVEKHAQEFFGNGNYIMARALYRALTELLPESPQLGTLLDSGVQVVVTDLVRLRDSNPGYSSLWRMFVQWWGNSPTDGWLPNPLDPTGRRVSLRTYLRLADFTRRNLDDYNLEASFWAHAPRGSALDRELKVYMDRIWTNSDGTYTLPYAEFRDTSRLRRIFAWTQEVSGVGTF